jgi:DNA processing protein
MHDPFVMLAVAEGFGESPVAALLQPGADPDVLLRDPPAAPAVPPRVAARLREADLTARAAAIRARAGRHDLQVLVPSDPGYPARLRDAPSRPLVLFVRGDPAVLARAPSAAFVGSRTPTPYGTDAAEALAAALARAGTTLWSGLARGIDAVAHEACITARVPTVAVLAGGLDAIYPPEHAELAQRIVAGGGCLVAELPPGHRARRGHFVRRNRVLATGAAAVVVVEASLASGALHTARFGAECGTDVFAVPGPWTSERSQGCHRLIAEGAVLIESPDAMLQSLGLQPQQRATDALRLATCADEQRVLSALASGPRPTDLLARECGLDRAAFVRAVFRLELAGAIARLPGDLWRRVCGATSR